MKDIEVVAAIIEDKGRIFAAQRGYGELKGGWEFPGGKLEEGEEEISALHREIKEELNATIEVKRKLMTASYAYENFEMTMHCYLCHLTSDYALLEHTQACWVDGSSVDKLEWLPADIQVLEALKRDGIL